VNAHRKINSFRNSFYIPTQTARKFTAFLRHTAESLSYFPQNVIYLIILYFPALTILTFFISHALNFNIYPTSIKGKVGRLCAISATGIIVYLSN